MLLFVFLPRCHLEANCYQMQANHLFGSPQKKAPRRGKVSSICYWFFCITNNMLCSAPLFQFFIRCFWHVAKLMQNWLTSRNQVAFPEAQERRHEGEARYVAFLLIFSSLLIFPQKLTLFFPLHLFSNFYQAPWKCVHQVAHNTTSMFLVFGVSFCCPFSASVFSTPLAGLFFSAAPQRLVVVFGVVSSYPLFC